MDDKSIKEFYPLNRLFYWTMALVCGLILTMFLFTMASTVYFEDSGLFGMVCYGAGVAHPPTYPLYSILCVLFAHLPWLMPIHGVAIFSAINAVVACFLIGLIVFRLSGVVWAAMISALIYGLSNSLWSQAIIQEVYTLNAALFFFALWRVLEFSSQPSAKNFHFMIFFSLLGLSNHWPLMMLSSIGFPLIIVPVWRRFFSLLWSRHGMIALGLMILALSPYLYSWLRSLTDPLISFYGPINSWNLFWFVITRQGYSGVDDAGGNWFDKQDYLWWLFESMVGEQITWVGLILLFFGLFFLLNKRKISALLGFLMCTLGSSVLLVLLLDFKFNDFSRSIFRVYPLVSWGMLALVIGLGIATIDDFGQKIKNKIGKKNSLLNYGALVFLVAPVLLWIDNYPKNVQPKITWAHKLAMTILQSLDKNAILFTHDDTHLPLMYLHVAQGVRRDVTIYNTQSLILNNRKTHVRVPLAKKKEVYRQLARHTSRPIYTFYASENPHGSIWNGVYYKADRNLQKNQKRNQIDLRFFDLLLVDKDAFLDNNAWSRNQKFRYAKNLSELLLKTSSTEAYHEQARNKILSTSFGQMAYANAWFEYRKPANEENLAFALMKKVEPLAQKLPPYQQSRFYDTYGRVQSVRASRIDYKKVEALFLQGVEAYPKNDSSSLYSLLELYAQAKSDKLFAKYSKQFPNAGRGSAIVAAYLKGEEYRPPKVRLNEQQARKKLQQALKYLRDKPFNPNEALRIASELEKYYSHIPGVSFVMGGARMMRREFNLAEQAFIKTLTLNPDHIDAQVNLLNIYFYEKKYRLISKSLKKALRKHPKNPRLLALKKRLNQLQSP